MANKGAYGPICASRLVVDSGIYRHEFVAQAVLKSIVQVTAGDSHPNGETI